MQSADIKHFMKGGEGKGDFFSPMESMRLQYLKKICVNITLQTTWSFSLKLCLLNVLCLSILPNKTSEILKSTFQK